MKIEVAEITAGDIIQFVSKADTDVVIKGEIISNDIENSRISLNNIDYPKVGLCGFSYWSLSKSYSTYKLNSTQ